MFKDRPLGVAGHRKQKLSSNLTCASIACSAVWFLVHNDEPRFNPSDDAIQEVIAFTIVPLQKTGDMLAVALMLFCHMSGHPPCSNVVEPKNVMH